MAIYLYLKCIYAKTKEINKGEKENDKHMV